MTYSGIAYILPQDGELTKSYMSPYNSTIKRAIRLFKGTKSWIWSASIWNVWIKQQHFQGWCLLIDDLTLQMLCCFFFLPVIFFTTLLPPFLPSCLFHVFSVPYLLISSVICSYRFSLLRLLHLPSTSPALVPASPPFLPSSLSPGWTVNRGHTLSV